MNSSSPARPDPDSPVKDHNYVAMARTAYQDYVDESTAAYQKYRAGLAAARGAELPDTAHAELTAPRRKYAAGLNAVRLAGPTAAWAAGLTAVHAAAAYYTYVVELAVVRAADPSDEQPPAELSNAERAAAAAAESAAAYQKYVAAPAAEGESDAPAGWSPAV
ncbi:MAG TPA: hypothetical protein VFW64_19765 [Pseudonocardiaceae bacterium]|nr:hypothetical protein [Pseudonocardiaceae bacterium]